MRPRFHFVGVVICIAFSNSVSAATVDMARYNPACNIKIESAADALTATWNSGDGTTRLVLNLARDAKLLSIETAPKDSTNFTRILQDGELEFPITVGSRGSSKNTFTSYVFFDKPADRPHETILAKLEKSSVKIESSKGHASIRIAPLSAGTFSGELIFHLYDRCPLIHVDAALTTGKPGIAYIYDALLSGGIEKIAFEDMNEKLQSRALDGDKLTPLAVRYRTLIGQTLTGAIALFPPPHAFFFPRDRTDNLSFVQFDTNRFGLRQDPAGGGAFVPWIDAPEGKTQHMEVFLLPSTAQPQALLDQVKRYTRGDTFKPLDGYQVFTSHYHSRLTVRHMQGKSPVREFAYVFKKMGVNIVHLAEFHGDGSPGDGGEKRLNEMKEMFNLCRNFSDDTLLLLPGEEGNNYLAHPWPPEKGVHPGHWMYFFPKPIYLTWVRVPGQAFSEDLPQYGKVYHIGDRDDMVQLLNEEKGLAWTTHPRIKASYATPDAFKDQPFYKSDIWLGAAWKAMPADLSKDRLGTRCLDLLDDISNWAVTGGYPLKALPGEVDVFEIERNHELYGHMNVNYVKLAKLPANGDAAPVIDVLRKREFFTTTGEILIPEFKLLDQGVTAKIEWTFPLEFIEVVSGDGKSVKRQRFNGVSSTEHSQSTIGIPHIDPDAKWVRLEVTDIARNFAYTQCIPIK